jgi:1-acyl-sn-glycerol-3-phosphate acyltransferase
MVLLKTVLIFIMVGLTMVLFIPIGIVVFTLSLLGLRGLMTFLVYKVAQAWARFLIACTGCTLRVTGQENIPRKGGICFVSNHGSIFDIVLLLAYAGRPIGFVAKKELSWIPLLNIWILLLGGLYIDRKTIRRAVNTINTGVKRIKSGGAMIIFPEGHRSKGRGLLPFHAGSFKLATQSEAPIVPVAISGSYDVFEKNYRIHALPVGVTFCKPIITAEIPVTDRRNILADQVRTVIAAALAGQE